MGNGNAESRSRWLTYASGTVLTSVVGTKGAGTVTKTGSSTPKPTVQQVRNTTDSVMSNYVNPFGPELAVSHGVHVPHGVLNGPTLKDELLLFAKGFKSDRLNVGGGKVNGNRKWIKTTNFKNVKVYQRNDIIDPNKKDAMGRTNIDKMRKGLAPLGPDGKSINLHHTTQRNSSSIAEVTQTFHKENSAVIHINPNTMPSGINRTEFNRWRTNYWKHRANDFSE